MRQRRLVRDPTQHRGQLSHATSFAFGAFAEPGGEVHAMDADDRDSGAARLHLAVQMRAEHAPPMLTVTPGSHRETAQDRNVECGLRIARLPDEHLHPEGLRELANAVGVTHFLQRNNVGVDAPEHIADQTLATHATGEDVVRGNTKHALFVSSCTHRATYNAMVTSEDRRRPVTELVFLDRGPVIVRAAAVAAVAIAAGVAGDLLYRLQARLASQLAGGGPLNPLQSLIAHGSSARTAWIGWVAALFFAIAAARVRFGPSEPAPGRAPLEQLTPAQLRSGLRREYVAVRVLLVILVLVTAVDAARAAALFTSTSPHGSTLVAMVIEVAGLAAATLALAVWAWWFSRDLRRLGAL
jgi:hypothetical protein